MGESKRSVILYELLIKQRQPEHKLLCWLFLTSMNVMRIYTTETRGFLYTLQISVLLHKRVACGIFGMCRVIDIPMNIVFMATLHAASPHTTVCRLLYLC